MADKLTQLQDAIDELAQQFVACIYYIQKHHSISPVAPSDTVRDVSLESDALEPYPAATFQAGLRELAQDLVIKEQQIEYIVSQLPGLTHSEREQEERIRVLEGELREAEGRRARVEGERRVLMGCVEEVLRGVRRP